MGTLGVCSRNSKCALGALEDYPCRTLDQPWKCHKPPNRICDAAVQLLYNRCVARSMHFDNIVASGHVDDAHLRIH